jgi:predicted nucleotidyltransferase
MWFEPFDPRRAALRAVEAARREVGDRLRGATLFGSAATGEFHPAHSDVNVAFVFSALGTTELQALGRAYPVFRRCRVARPLLLSEDTLRRSLDAYPLEYLLIRERSETLHGADYFGPLELDREALRLEVERVLRAQELGLGLSYVALAGTRGGARQWAIQASNAIAASASGLLYLAGELLPREKGDLAARCAVLFGVDRAAFVRLLTIRERKGERVEAITLLDSALKILNQLLESAERMSAPSPKSE